MAVLTFPSITPSTQEMGVKFNTQVTTTSLSGIIQTVELPGARWQGTMQFRDMTPTEASTLNGFLASLRGSSGRFFLGDFGFSDPLDTTLSGSLTVQAGSTRRDIIINSPSAGGFAVGDRIQIGTDDDREYKIITAVNTATNLSVEPMIRRQTFIGQSVVYSDPVGVFLLDSDDHAKWAIRSKAKLSDVSFGFIEAFT